jgi:hypothetical protein
VPEAAAAEIVTLAVPVFVRVTGTVAVVFIRMLPNATVVALGVRIPTLAGGS